ncbi:MAG: DNA polymerase III subunit alpha, partial [Chloroflexi bacterium]|nr:DNA polymerase III subunit alpha [Chloroflexota bacterium]
IRFGLAAIKNVGTTAIETLLEARGKGGHFSSIEDFCQRANLRGVNKRVLESLVKAGALDPLGSRGALLASIDRILSLAQREHQMREKGQTTMFDLFGEEVAKPSVSIFSTLEDIPPQEKLMWEKELLGVYLSQHPFTAIAPHLATATFCGQVNAELVGEKVTVAGIVAAVRQLYTKDRRLFVAATLEDLEGSLEVTAWPEVYERTTYLWTEGNILLVEGKVRMRGNQVQLSCDNATLYQPEREKLPESGEHVSDPMPTSATRQLFITLTSTLDETQDVSRLQAIMNTLREYPGSDIVHLIIAEDGEMVELEFPDTTGYCPQLQERLTSLVGPSGSVSWKER